MTTEKTAVALRILAALNRKEPPEERDIALLRAYLPDHRDLPPDELACVAVHQLPVSTVSASSSIHAMDGDKELARLHDQLEQTRDLYDRAKLEHDRAVERMKDLGATHPDGSVRHATVAYTHALQTYRSALVEYNRFLLDRTFPAGKPPGPKS